MIWIEKRLTALAILDFVRVTAPWLLSPLDNGDLQMTETDTAQGPSDRWLTGYHKLTYTYSFYMRECIKVFSAKDSMNYR